MLVGLRRVAAEKTDLTAHGAGAESPGEKSYPGTSSRSTPARRRSPQSSSPPSYRGPDSARLPLLPDAIRAAALADLRPRADDVSFWTLVGFGDTCQLRGRSALDRRTPESHGRSGQVGSGNIPDSLDGCERSHSRSHRQHQRVIWPITLCREPAWVCVADPVRSSISAPPLPSPWPRPQR